MRINIAHTGQKAIRTNSCCGNLKKRDAWNKQLEMEVKYSNGSWINRMKACERVSTMWLKIRTNDRLLRKIINTSARKAGANVILSRGTTNDSYTKTKMH